MPKAWPPTDEVNPITGAFLTDPLVAGALAYINQAVPAKYLSIAPSKYTSPCVAAYPTAAAQTNCYWPFNLCTRNADVPGAFLADISSCPNANDWGITYDDGPISANGVSDTTALLTALKTANVKSTFFIVGSNGIQHPELVSAADQAGHQIAGHTWTHYPLTSLTNEQIVAEFRYTEAMIYQAIGKLPTMFRPPCGDIDDRVRAIASALGYRAVIWTNTRDDTAADVTTQTAAASQQIEATIKTWFTPQPGFVSLQHDIDDFTTKIGIDTLSAIAAAGASFPLKPQPVGTCVNLPFYHGNNTVAPAVSSSSSAAAAAASSASMAAASTAAAAVSSAAAAPATATVNVIASPTATPTSATSSSSSGSSSSSSSGSSPAPGAGTTVNVQSGASALGVQVAGLAAAGLVAAAGLL
ncbi:chitin deacetylase [Geranomyces variabilis]|uniref:Chitin deacetylase n=1 Tax=Geranomyces variabilis TaxID=109894 RepID=A0AAD5XKD7_9FUNG|nr:chitin deacetylase [Geranomyces variabilis]